jgi:hypothetical protein
MDSAFQFAESPALMEFSPSAVSVNSVPFTLTVNGANFGTDAVVFWNDIPQSTRFVNPKQLLVTVTDTDLMESLDWLMSRPHWRAKFQYLGL